MLYTQFLLINGPINTFNQVLWIYFIKALSNSGGKNKSNWATFTFFIWLCCVMWLSIKGAQKKNTFIFTLCSAKQTLLSASTWSLLTVSIFFYFSAPLSKWTKISLIEESPNYRWVNKRIICHVVVPLFIHFRANPEGGGGGGLFLSFRCCRLTS